MSNNQNGNQIRNRPGATILAVIIVALFFLGGCLFCNSASGIDDTHDSNGFMGCSDSFRDWAGRQ